MAKTNRSKDTNQLAKLIAAIATDEVEEESPDTTKNPAGGWED